MCNNNYVFRKEKEKMTEIEYQKAFNDLLKGVSELLEATGNYDLLRIVKKKLFDFSDKIKGERANGTYQK